MYAANVFFFLYVGYSLEVHFPYEDLTQKGLGREVKVSIAQEG